MQWKLLPENVVTSFWKRKRKKQKQNLKIREKRMVQLEQQFHMTWGGRRGGRVTTPSQVMVRQWGLSQAKFYHMQPGASPAGFVTLVKGQERQLKIMTAEKIMQVLLSQWRGMQLVNFGGVLLKQELNFLLMLETMTAQLLQIYMLKCHMMF